MNKLEKIDNFYIFNCPHCTNTITVSISELNCKIFRCGVYKDTYKQIDPHLNKKECDKLFIENKIFGCSKPFEIIEKNNILYCIKCDYK
jgi:hypothetical protein